MTMDKTEKVAAMEVERFSKLGTSKLHQGETQKALAAYRKAYASSGVLGRHGYMQRACAFNLGAILITLKNYSEGLTYLEKAIPPPGTRDGKSNGDLYFNKGLAYRGLNNILEAMNWYKKALEEYKIEQDNVRMEADTVYQLGRLGLESGKVQEAVTWMQQLESAYTKLGDTMKFLQVQAERSALLLKLGKISDAEEVASTCMQGLENATPSPKLGQVYIELGLIYTQLRQYEKALKCNEIALPLVQFVPGDQHMLTILYQNLGAIHNYMHRYEEAIKYHQAAAKKHAEQKHVKSRGHCYLNLGYAYSQLNDLDKADEYFILAHQAAKESGDTRTEWQSLESRGAAAFNNKALQKAQEYYRMALVALAKSAESEDSGIHDRIVAKWTQTQELKKEARRKETVALKASTGMPPPPSLSRSSSKMSGVIERRHGSKKRYLKVRRSGTLRKFDKIALGLDPNFDDDDGKRERSEEEDEEDSSSELAEEDEDEYEENDDDEFDRRKAVRNAVAVSVGVALKNRPPDSYIPQRSRHVNSSELEKSEEGDDDDDDVYEDEDASDDEEKEEQEQLKKALRKVAGGEGGRTSVQRQVQVDVHAENNASESEDEEETSTDSGSSESEDEESPTNSLRTPTRPALPSSSPPNTHSIRTYEEPQHSGLYNEITDHKPPAGHSRSMAAGVTENSRTIYESIRPPTRRGIDVKTSSDDDNDDDDDNEAEKKDNARALGSDDEEVDPPSLPRGEMDKKLYESHVETRHREQQQRIKEAEEGGIADFQMGNKDSSKPCIVM